MRTFSIFRPASFRTVGGWICAAACVLSSCVDDTFDKHRQGISPYLTFEVEVPVGWTGGQAARSAAGQSDISIKRMTRSDGGKPLYLVTEISEAAADTAASGVISRGTPVDTRNFPGTFGLFAFGIGGASWTEGGTEKTSYENMEVKKGTNGVWMPQTETLWQWPGKGQIDFYAYSPRIGESSPVLPPAEEPADGGDENAPAGEQELSFSYSVGEDNKPVLAYTVPSDVTKQIDLMTAHHTYAGDGSECAHLTFSHALTAVTIKTGAEMLKGTIKSVTISGVYGEGTYQIGADGWTIPQKAEKRDFVVTLGNDSKPDATNEEPDTDTGKGSGMYQDKDTPIVKDEYTFMMIPQKLEGAKLTVVFTDEFSKTEWTLTADLIGEWPMGKMVTYSINSTGIVVKPVVTWKINRDVLPNGGFKEADDPLNPNESVYGEEMTNEEKNAYFPVSGYLSGVEISASVQVIRESTGNEVTVPGLESFSIEYSVDEQQTWTKGNWISASSEEVRSNRTDSYKKGAIHLSPQPIFQTFNQKFNLIEKGTKEVYYDLVENSLFPDQKESANCYIVNSSGYYKFPAYYGNTYRNDANNERAYTYMPSDKHKEEDPNVQGFILKNFKNHNNQNVTSGKIDNVKDAVIVWQDSPDLVADVKLIEQNGEQWVGFYIGKETINQGNAVIAVRDDSSNILWSWHIWVTSSDWSTPQMASSENEEGQNFWFAPCNLGYCDSHGTNEARNIYVRFKVTMPDGSSQIVKNFGSESAGIPQPDEGVFTFVQPEIVASIAGDNTYYQWGRKDPMLPGVYNSEVIGNGAYSEELDMLNKMFYSTKQYRFTASESGRPIGDGIKYPNEFFIHKRPQSDTDNGGVDNRLRRHWHDGTQAYDQQTIMNFWNSQLNQNGINGTDEAPNFPNNIYVFKTIYDPSPAGYKIPPPTAFSAFSKKYGGHDKIGIADLHGELKTEEVDGRTILWKIKDANKKEFEFPATGLRDMGIRERKVEAGTWPAHSKLTFIATSGFVWSRNEDTKIETSSCLLFSIDYRNNTKEKHPVGNIYGTNNAYGFTLRPVRDHQHNNNTSTTR